jgi:maltokinase
MGVDREALSAHVAALAAGDAGALLPPRRAEGGATVGEVVLRDALPLPGGQVISVLRSGGDVLVAPLVPGHGTTNRAVPGDGAFEGLLALIQRGEPVGRFVFHRFAGSADGQGEPRGERAIDVDQSNESVVVGEQVVVKLYPFTAPGPQPGLELPVHLAEAGFAEIPAPVGAVTWTDEEGDEVLLATAVAFLPGARDGWEWYLALLLGWLDGEADEDAALAPAREVGTLTGRLHAALATPTSVLPEPVHVVGPATLESWRARAEATLAEALALTDGPEGERLRAIEGRAHATLDALDDPPGTLAMRIHGDLHVGQLLRWEHGLAVTDFDGNPMAPVAERRALASPARDLASLVRSVDHLGRIAYRRREGRDADIERWIARSVPGVIEAYRDALAAHGRADLFDGRLLRPFEVAQEAHEFVYAARFLPRWRYVPDLAMAAMFPPEERAP